MEKESSETSGTVRVWDPLVRIGHWVLAAGFAVAYLTEGEPEVIHVWTGYTIGVIVVLRIVWGLVGPEHARFSDFVYRPGNVLRYLVDLLRFRSKRYVGHSPAGGAMVVALLLSLAATVFCGLQLYAVKENSGPLALLAANAQETGAAGSPYLQFVSDDEERDRDDDELRGKASKAEEDFWKETHELFANLTLFLVILHVLGVAVASFSHRENLVRAMFTGRKRQH